MSDTHKSKRVNRRKLHSGLMALMAVAMLSGVSLVTRSTVRAADGDTTALSTIDNNQKSNLSAGENDTSKQSQVPTYTVENVTGFATIVSKYASIWETMNWTNPTPSATYYHKTVRYNQIVTTDNGSKYLRLVTPSGSVIGFINVVCASVTSQDQGVAISGSGYATVMANRGNIYRDFEWHVASTLKSYWHHTLQIKSVYYHSNNQVYYSMYTGSGKWVGYFNSRYVKQSPNGQLGTGIIANKYVTLTKKNYAIYSNLRWNKLTTSNAKLHTTYRVVTEYHHSNGSVYYQLRNFSGSITGYINAKATTQGTGAQGSAVSYSKSVSLTGSAAVWKNFAWAKASKQYSSLKGKQLKVHCYYHHLNGSTYYSVYTTEGVWVGYVNATGTKAYVAPKPAKPLWLRPSENKPYPNLNKYPNAYFDVNLSKQRVYIKNGNKVLYTMICSTGLYDWTPTGTYHIQAERGTAFSGANYWTSWLNHGQYLFHTVIVNHDRSYNVAAAKKLGHKASHGCIRLPVPDAYWIYKNAKVGMKVVIHN